MKPGFRLQAEAYAEMLDSLHNLFHTEKPGQAQDVRFCSSDSWLSDSAVVERISRRGGAWEISLLFAHHQNPLQFLCRRISAHSCPKRAATFAFYMRRMAAKDQRGTLRLDIDLLGIQPN
jgi:hypothetical protein